MVDVLAQLAREGTTMVMATHDLRLASKIANEVIVLDGGVIVETGTSRDIFTQPEAGAHQAFYCDADP